MTQLVDYAWSKPSPAAIAAAGYAGVLRYLSYDAGKNLSAAERDGLLAAGLAIGLVWETTATRAGQGAAAGRSDVAAAEAQADALGYPVGSPIFYAVDYDAQVSAVAPYFQGVAGAARRPVGVYGSAAVIEGVPVPWKWQTTAWSHGRVSPQAHIYQTLRASLPGCDLNELLHPVPLWSTRPGGMGGIGAGIVHIPGPPTFPTTTTPAPLQEDDDMDVYAFSTPTGLGFRLRTAMGETDLGTMGDVDACMSAINATVTRTWDGTKWVLGYPYPCTAGEAAILASKIAAIRGATQPVTVTPAAPVDMKPITDAIAQVPAAVVALTASKLAK